MTQENEKTEHVMKIVVQNNMSNTLGIASFIFGLISIFFLAPVFVPLALLFGIIAIIKKQLAWGIIGIICSIIGFVTSPILLGIFGLVSLGTVGLNLENNRASNQNIPSQTFAPPLKSYTSPQPYIPSNISLNKNTLNVDEQLLKSESLTSNNGQYKLLLQEDGNLVILRAGTNVIWASGTDRKPVQKLIMQADGNLVLYLPNKKPVWASGTDGKGADKVVLQNNGNLVLYRPNGSQVWATR